MKSPANQQLATPSLESSDRKQQKKKKKRKTQAKAIPLVKGSTATSLVKKRQSETGPSSRSGGRKRSRNSNAANGNTGKEQQKQLFSSTAESLAVISKFHTLNKRLEQNARDETLSEVQRQKNAEAIRKEQEAMGGLDRYQKASMYGARSSKFVCADWVVPLLQKQRSSGQRLRILDVGAIDNQYYGKGYDDWLDAVPIDLHGGQHESVMQIDFFDYAHEYCSGTDPAAPKATTTTTTTTTPQPYDAIVLSLVLNFQGDPRKRGDMLALAADPRLLTPKSNGMLFVALPSASLDNSRYCDLERFLEVATNPLFCLELVEQKVSAKLVLLAFRRTEVPTANETKNRSKQPPRKCCYDAATKTFEYGDHEMKRLPAKPGTKRNNFAVILKSTRNRT